MLLIIYILWVLILLVLIFSMVKLIKKKVGLNSHKYIIKISKFNMKHFYSMEVKYKDIGRLQISKVILYLEKNKILNFLKKFWKY